MGGDDARLQPARRLSQAEFEALTPAERLTWFRSLHVDEAPKPQARAEMVLTSAELARLSQIPPTPEAEKDAFWQRLHAKLLAAGT